MTFESTTSETTTSDPPAFLRAAKQFMAIRGLSDVQPIDVVREPGEWHWSLFYELPEGRLNLGVTWSVEDDWRVKVQDFRRHRD